jgi:hypothetical protein
MSTTMTKRYKTIPAGAFKGKKITVADTDRVEDHREIAREFMEVLFDLSPGEYAISDESNLSDFVSFVRDRTNELCHQVEAHYAVRSGSACLNTISEEICGSAAG